MMLQDKVTNIIELIDDVTANRETAAENENSAKRNNMFFDRVEVLTPIIKSYIIAVKRFKFTIEDVDIQNMNTAMQYAKTTFDSEKAVNPINFRNIVDNLNNSIKSRWEQFFKGYNSEINDYLRMIVQVHNNSGIIKQCGWRMNKCSNWPLDENLVEDYFIAKNEAELLLREIKFDDEICDFLKKASDKTATLSDLTPNILEWIKEENLSDKIILTIRPS